MTKSTADAGHPSAGRRRRKTASTTRVTATRKVLDLSEAAEKLRPADRKRLFEIAKEYNDRPVPVAVRLEKVGTNKWNYIRDGTEAENMVTRLRMLAAFGSFSEAFIETMMGELLTIWDSSGGISDKSYNAALAVLESAAPQNELEAMLVVQMIAANEAGLRATSMVGNAASPGVALGFGNLANKYMRTFVAQSEALAKMRRGGEQIVKYIHVHEGGQAVVAGTINQGGGRVNAGTSEQPYEQAANAPVEALSGPNTAWDHLPVSGDAEREMSYSRGQESWPSQG